MAFGLKNRKVPKEEIDKRVKEAANILAINEYLKRKPKALSGGQCQRVALGRAIVRQAKVFLMDEPLSNLDAKLRVQMRSEIIKLHRRIGTITIYVTHDQTEAMTMADRIVVMNKGYIQQVGTPKEIYEHPVNMFVAGFIGSPSMNFMKVKFNGKELILDNNHIALKKEQIALLKDHGGDEFILGIRPEDIMVNKDDQGIKSKVDVLELLGHEEIVHVQIGENENVQIICSSKTKIENNDDIYLSFDLNYLHVFDKDNEETIF